jgi:hypothetical protein
MTTWCKLYTILQYLLSFTFSLIFTFALHEKNPYICFLDRTICVLIASILKNILEVVKLGQICKDAALLITTLTTHSRLMTYCSNNRTIWGLTGAALSFA